jgi:prepilin-type processing-associated H-X9-DG protein
MREEEIGLLKRYARELSRSNDPPYLADPLYNLAMGWLREGPHPGSDVCNYAFCDGGQTGKNGSTGTFGTYGVCLMSCDPDVDDTFAISKQMTGGTVGPSCFNLGWDQVTNNQAEFTALIRALCWLPDGWDGFVVIDSEITIKRWERLGHYLYEVKGQAHEDILLFQMLSERVPNAHPLYWPGHGKGTDHLTAGNAVADEIATIHAMNYREFMQGLEISVEKGLEYMALEEAFNGGF